MISYKEFKDMNTEERMLFIFEMLTNHLPARIKRVEKLVWLVLAAIVGLFVKSLF